MKDKLIAIAKILRAKKWMLIVPKKDDTAFDVETTFEDSEFSRSGNALYFKKA